MSIEKEMSQFKRGVKSVMRTTVDGRTYYDLVADIEGDSKFFHIYIFDAERGELERRKYYYDKKGKRRISNGKENGTIAYFDPALKNNPFSPYGRFDFFERCFLMMDFHFTSVKSKELGYSKGN